MSTSKHLVQLFLSIALALLLTVIFSVSAFAGEPASPVPTPTRLVIPSIALDSQIIPVGVKHLVVDGKNYAMYEVAPNDVGWHNLSAPLGQAGNTVLAGHSNVNTRIFENLDKVGLGATITVSSTGSGQNHQYVVSRKILVQEKGMPLATRVKNAQWIAPSQDERLTLITCAYPGATHRLIVVAQPINQN